MLRCTLLLSLILALHACSPRPLGGVGDRCEDHPLYASLASDEGASLRVIVTLVHEEGDDVRALQDRLLRALEGTDHELLQRPQNFPILVLDVGRAAFCRVIASPLVAAVQRDEAVPPSSS